MEGLPAAFGFRHHRRLENFCHDGNPLLSRLDPGLSLHLRWENFLVDGIHLPCLTIEAEKHPSAMDESWKRSFFPIHRLWYKLPCDGKKCQNKIFQSIGGEINHRAMEESGRASFSRTIGFDWRRKWMENFCQTNSRSFTHHRIWDKPSCDGRNCGTSISDHQDWDKPPGDGLHLDTCFFPLHRGLISSCTDGGITSYFWLKTPSTLW